MENLWEYVKKVKEWNGFDEVMKWYRMKPNEEGEYKCPFHKDKEYSFGIHKNKLFYCRVCLIVGDIIDFVCRKEGFNFWQALDRLTPLGIKFPFKEELKLSLRRFNLYEDDETYEWPEGTEESKKNSLYIPTRLKSMMTPDEVINKVSLVAYLEANGFQPSRSNFIVVFDHPHSLTKVYPTYNYSGNPVGYTDIIDFHSGYKGISYAYAKAEIEEMLNEKIIPGVDFQKKYLPKDLDLCMNEKEEKRCSELIGIYVKECGLSENLSKDIARFRVLTSRIFLQKRAFSILESASGELDEESFEYLTGPKRILAEETIKKFKLFTVADDFWLRKRFEAHADDMRKKIYGLFEFDDFLFDMHRIIIPYSDGYGICFLRGRYFYNNSDIPVYGPKYICPSNSSLTLGPKRFFNFRVIDDIKEDEPLLICENEFNTMVAEQLGYKAIGISAISNFPSNQINYIQDLNIYLLMNNNEYSKKGAIEIAKMFERPVKIIDIKKYVDLTELVSNVGEVDLLNDSKYVEVREFEEKS